MDGKLKFRMNTAGLKEADARVKVSDVSKYNLRCNRSLSERMTKKDFVYDICRPLNTVRKLEKLKKLPTAMSTAPREQQFLEITNHSKIPKKRRLDGGGTATVQYPVHRILNYECNFCREQIATLFSLSTHVKFHRRKYCRSCYWVLEDGETVEKHYDKRHDRSTTSRIFTDS